jgi:type I restriction-modification system DNA methylase subunit
MVDRLDNLIGIFQKPELDFSQNRAEHDDILGDAYEYLMRHFATESGKSKGQFYTPSEVSRVIAKVIGISPANTKASTTAYDPTCGSGSLLQLAAAAGKHIAIAAVLTDMDAELPALEARRDKTRALEQGMMQELLTDRTRFVAPNEAEMQA